MPKFLKIIFLIVATVSLTACPDDTYKPRRLRCDFGSGQEQTMEPVYDVYTSDGFLVWYMADGKRKKHSPSTDCMVVDPLDTYPNVRIADGKITKLPMNVPEQKSTK